MNIVSALLLATALLTACSDDGTSSSALLVGALPCPSTPPLNGSQCELLGTHCSWGSSERFGCRTQATCGDWHDDPVWVVTKADCPEPPPECPTSPPETDGGFGQSDCGKLGLTCVYDHTAYTCTPCSGTLCWENAFWSVSALESACPAEMPNLGAACGSPGLWCDYNVCADDQEPGQSWAYGIAMKCRNGAWVFDSNGQVCP